MGEIIRFRPRQGARPVLDAAADTIATTIKSATILFFTGVRYERHDRSGEVPRKRPLGRGSRRKRA
jgi:hypothetical protein